MIICKVTEKAFHKNAKTCRVGFHKKPTKQDGTHLTICSQITIPTSIFPTTHTIIPYSLFWNGCVYLCIVNKFECGDCGLGCALKGVESKVPWVSSCMGFVPEGSSMSSQEYKSHTP